MVENETDRNKITKIAVQGQITVTCIIKQAIVFMAELYMQLQ